ncbi:MAG: hypothetical protein MI919_28855 [Holophagales bacterium]|nr:hypothetical protein [Holophagales bacterium]
MALEDFYGQWQVWQTAGTSFGLGDLLTLGGLDGELSVAFDPPVSSPDLQVRYDASRDQVEIEGLPRTRRLVIARYVDPSDYDYRALYGAAKMDGTGRLPERMATFSAVYYAALSAPWQYDPTAPSEVTLTGSDFDGNWVVKSTSGSQFGIRSAVSVKAAGGDVHITSALLATVPTPEVMAFDQESGTLGGKIDATESNPQTVIQLAQAPLPSASGGTTRSLFGLAVVGDPENSGVFGGDEEDPAPQPNPGLA